MMARIQGYLDPLSPHQLKKEHVIVDSAPLAKLSGSAHVDIITENNYRNANTPFRLSSHDLAIERGRYQNIDRKEVNAIPVEVNKWKVKNNFLLVFPLYRELRHMKSYYCSWSALFKFDSLTVIR